MNNDDGMLISEEEIASLRRILKDAPLETDDDCAALADLVEDESCDT